MPMSSDGRVESSSDYATRPKAQEIGLTGCAVPTPRSSHIGHYVMATAEHREPCDSRGSCTVLGAPGGEIPPGDSTRGDIPGRSTSLESRQVWLLPLDRAGPLRLKIFAGYARRQLSGISAARKSVVAVTARRLHSCAL